MDTWIVDSGATCHMCNDRKYSIAFDDREPVSVALGDGHSLQALGTGKVAMKMNLPDGREKLRTLFDVS